MSPEINDLLNKIIYFALVAIFTLIYKTVRQYFDDKHLLEFFDYIVDSTVKSLEQTEAKPKRNGEGRVSIELGNTLKSSAISAIKATLGDERLKRLNELTGKRDVNVFIADSVEAKVLTVQNSSKTTQSIAPMEPENNEKPNN